MILALLAGGLIWMRSSALFAVDQAIVPATLHLTEGQLRTALAPASGQNLFKLSTSEFEEVLEKLPYVRDAQVFRRFPRALEVSLEEYQPAARVQLADGRIWLVAEDGRVLEPDKGQASDQVVIVPAKASRLKPGAHLPGELRGALQLSADLAGQDAPVLPVPARTLTISGGGQASLVLENGIEVRLGELNQLDEKLMVVRQIIDEYLREGRELAYVDVYLPERPVAKVKAP